MAQEIALKRSDFHFEWLITFTLTLIWVILHTIVHHSSTSTYVHAIFHWNWRNFLWTDIRTDKRTFENGFIRSTLLKSRPKKPTEIKEWCFVVQLNCTNSDTPTVTVPCYHPRRCACSSAEPVQRQTWLLYQVLLSQTHDRPTSSVPRRSDIRLSASTGAGLQARTSWAEVRSAGSAAAPTGSRGGRSDCDLLQQHQHVATRRPCRTAAGSALPRQAVAWGRNYHWTLGLLELWYDPSALERSNDQSTSPSDLQQEAVWPCQRSTAQLVASCQGSETAQKTMRATLSATEWTKVNPQINVYSTLFMILVSPIHSTKWLWRLIKYYYLLTDSSVRCSAMTSQSTVCATRYSAQS